MSETLTPESQMIACWGSIPEQHAAGEGKLNGVSPTYIRYGSPVHTELEDRVAEIAGIQPEHLLIFNNGLKAVSDTVDAALNTTTPRNGKKLRIALPSQTYGGTYGLIADKIRERGLLFTFFDAGSAEETADALENSDVLLIETVANAPDAPVADHNTLIALHRKQEKKTKLIFDSTLTLSTECDVYDQITPEDEIAIVESATKSYTNNAEKLGWAASKNPTFLQAIRAKRNKGSIPGIGSARYALELLPTKNEFHERNSRIFSNTGVVALKLYEASLLPHSGFTVDHPSLPNHVNYGQDHVTNGGNNTPVIFLNPQTTGTLDEKADQVKAFATKIADDPGVDPLIQRSDSFAFDITAINSTRESSFVRIAPGANIDPTQVANALFNAITK